MWGTKTGDHPGKVAGSFLCNVRAHLESFPVANRPQHRGHFHSEFFLDLVQQLERAEAGPVHLVHESEDGQLPELAHLCRKAQHKPAEVGGNPKQLICCYANQRRLECGFAPFKLVGTHPRWPFRRGSQG